MNEINLLPCPFCGGEAKVIKQRHREYAPTYYVRCTKFTCRNETPQDSNINEAVRRWNTRKPMDDIVEKLEEEKKIHTEHYNISLYKDYPDVKRRYEQIQLVIDKTIEIVKAGGKG